MNCPVCIKWKWLLSCIIICHRVGYFWLPFFSTAGIIKEKIYTDYSISNIFYFLSNFFCCLGHIIEEILLEDFLKAVFSHHVTNSFIKCTSVSLNISVLLSFLLFFEFNVFLFLDSLILLEHFYKLKKKGEWELL